MAFAVRSHLYLSWTSHAEVRGYPYWKALTTGKGVALGGVPHDTYGMTTQSEAWCQTGDTGKLSSR